MKLKTTEIPNRAKKLFIKLYCEKKGGKTYENLHNAAQSWLSLSITKKQPFYDTVSTKSAIKKAQLIIQTEPYLRAKFPPKLWKQNQKRAESEGNLDNVTSDSDHTTTVNLATSAHDDTITECASNSYVEDHHVNEPEISDVHKQQQSYRNDTGEETDTADEFEDERNAENIPVDEPVLPNTINEPEPSNVQKQQPSYMSVIDEDTDTADEFEDLRNAEKVPLVEPVLPIVTTGQELFDLLKARNGITKSYNSLTMKEKHLYGRAVTNIKKDYVKKFKEYLERLPSRELFDYYKKIF